MVSSLALLALASGALALKVTSPDSSTIWSTGEKETIKWDTVSTDQPSFDIYLSNMASYPPTNILLASDVKSSDGSFEIDGSKLVKGNSYTINFTNGTKTEQIYAQSNQFNITQGSDSTSSTASSGSASASATGTSSSGSASASATGTSSSEGSSASGSATRTGASSSSTSSSAATSGAGKVVASWVGVAALAALAL